MKKLNYIHLGVTLTGIFVFLSAFTRGKGVIWFFVGAILIAIGAFNIIIKIKEANNPAYKKTNRIDDKDERIMLIKTKAKASTYDMTIFTLNLCIIYYLLNDKTGVVLVLVGIIILQLISYEISKFYYNKLL